MPTKLNDILSGWKNLIFRDPEIEKIAHNRALICSECRHSKFDFCVKCGCPLITKCRALENTCPIKKWPE